MNSKVLLGVTFIVLVVVVGAAYVTLPKNSALPVTQPAAVTDAATDTATTTSTTTKSYTLAQIATHNSASSCWAAINGNVYDLTQWINQHPGGPEHILNICGTDGSAAFNGQHSGDTEPQQELTKFLIGTLVQ